jgi:hypothetical protein
LSVLVYQPSILMHRAEPDLGKFHAAATQASIQVIFQDIFLTLFLPKRLPIQYSSPPPPPPIHNLVFTCLWFKLLQWVEDGTCVHDLVHGFSCTVKRFPCCLCVVFLLCWVAHGIHPNNYNFTALKEQCHLVRIFSAHANLKNYGSSFSSFPIQYGGFARRIHKLYAKICIVSYRRACRRGLRESILGTEQFPIISEILLLCAPGDTAPLKFSMSWLSFKTQCKSVYNGHKSWKKPWL